MTIQRERVGTGVQDIGIERERERGNTHEGTAVGRREAMGGEMCWTGNRAGPSGWS